MVFIASKPFAISEKADLPNVPNFEILTRDHPFSMNEIFFEKLTVRIPRYVHVRVGIRRLSNVSFLENERVGIRG